MKSELKQNTLALSVLDRTYPYLGCYKSGGIKKVVLFTKPRTGVIVWSSCEVLGYVNNTWHEEWFEMFNESVILSN